MKIAIGCDHGGFELKEAVRAGGYTVLSAECAEDARHAG